MVWLVRVLIFSLLATTGVVPLPWGHSHQGMQQSELNRHHQQCHLTESTDQLPQGWHWHFCGCPKTHGVAVLPGSERFANIDSQFTECAVDLATSCFAYSLRHDISRCEAHAQAVLGPKIYLQLLVLRN